MTSGQEIPSTGQRAADGTGWRTVHDTMGELQVPADARYGATTARAVDNFPISGRPVDGRVIRVLAAIKAEAARVNASLAEVDGVDEGRGSAIAAVADEVASGRWADQFPVDTFQTGSGTSTNMNVNEVIATLAVERAGGDLEVHPNDHVNASQSSNDVFPTAVHLAVALAVRDELQPALGALVDALAGCADRFAGVVKAGRTHLMDATPVTMGQEFAGYAAQIADGRDRLGDTLPRVCQVPLGGTATGTGINAPAGFAPRVRGALAERTGLPVSAPRDHFAAQASRDSLVELSGQLRVLAVSLTKIANDIRWMGSGPRTGLGELRLPALQPGSSIMPGKVNPVIPEVVTQVAAQVFGNDAAIAFAGSQGAFELNVYVPVMADNLLESISLLSAACRALDDKCLAGLEADEERCRAYAESTPALATALAPAIGYEPAAAVVKESLASGRSIRDVVVERDLLPADDADALLDTLAMTRPPDPADR
jgi:fumarate hydratase, class II